MYVRVILTVLASNAKGYQYAKEASYISVFFDL